MNDIEKRLTDLERRIKNLEDKLIEKISITAEDDSNTKMNLNEFLNKKNLDSDVKRALAIAYWLDHFNDMDNFNVSDMIEHFQIARFTLPKNMNDKINLNVKTKHIAPRREKKDDKKAWYITQVGIDFVENKLNKINN